MEAQTYRDNIERASAEICNLAEQNSIEQPKSLDLAVKEQLQNKDFTLLAFRKYCDYQKYSLYQELRAGLIDGSVKSLSDKERVVEKVTSQETTWLVVFEAVGVKIYEKERAELEFRKALYRHKFNRAWNNDILRVESDHYTIMGALLEFTKTSTSAEIYKENPLTLSNNQLEYRIPEDQLPTFLKDLSEELLLMLCQRFRQGYGRELTHFEIKHQHLLDQI